MNGPILISRREVAGRLASLLPTYAVLQYVLRRDLFAAPYKAEGDRWLARVHEASHSLIGRRLTPVHGSGLYACRSSRRCRCTVQGGADEPA